MKLLLDTLHGFVGVGAQGVSTHRFPVHHVETVEPQNRQKSSIKINTIYCSRLLLCIRRTYYKQLSVELILTFYSINPFLSSCTSFVHSHDSVDVAVLRHVLESVAQQLFTGQRPLGDLQTTSV